MASGADAGGEAEEGHGPSSVLEALIAMRTGSMGGIGAVVAWEDLSGFRIDLPGRTEFTLWSLEWGFKRIDATYGLTAKNIITSRAFARRLSKSLGGDY